jgi:hypothetical protein
MNASETLVIRVGTRAHARLLAQVHVLDVMACRERNGRGPYLQG